MAKRGSPEWRANISRQRRKTAEIDRQASRVGMRDLGRLRRTGTVSRALRPLAELAQLEAVELAEALGGDDRLSPQRRLLIEDVASAGLFIRALTAMAVQSEAGPDPELVSKIATMMGQRRQTLAALGLDRFERELDLSQYLAQRRENGPGDENAETNGADDQEGDDAREERK